jgi:hypothetical protein
MSIPSVSYHIQSNSVLSGSSAMDNDHLFVRADNLNTIFYYDNTTRNMNHTGQFIHSPDSAQTFRVTINNSTKQQWLQQQHKHMPINHEHY